MVAFVGARPPPPSQRPAYKRRMQARGQGSRSIRSARVLDVRATLNSRNRALPSPPPDTHSDVLQPNGDIYDIDPNFPVEAENDHQALRRYWSLLNGGDTQSDAMEGCVPRREMLVSLHSDEGRCRLASAISVLPAVASAHAKQIGKTHCGPRALATSLAAFVNRCADNLADSPATFAALCRGEEDVIGRGVSKGVVSRDELATGGMSLSQLAVLAHACGLVGCVLHAANSAGASPAAVAVPVLSGPDDVGRVVRAELSAGRPCLANYHMTTLGQPPWGGHFSVVAALEGASGSRGSVLLLDPWPDTCDTWVPLETLYDAMNTVDKASGQKRGLLLLSAPATPSPTPTA